MSFPCIVAVAVYEWAIAYEIWHTHDILIEAKSNFYAVAGTQEWQQMTKHMWIGKVYFS